MIPKRLLLRISTVIVLIVFAESVSRIVVRNDWVLETTPLISNMRWMLSWQKRHGKNLTSYPIDSFNPTLGWLPTPGIVNARLGRATVNINADSIRGTRTYARTKPEGIRRIVAVGDSFTFGEDVNDDETIPFLLEQQLPKTEVPNLGVHGYGLDQMTLRLSVDGYSYHPDIVLYTFIKDDMDRSLLWFRDYLKPQYVLEHGALSLTRVPVRNSGRLASDLQKIPAVVSLVRLLWDRFAYRGDHNGSMEPLITAIWNKTVEDIRSNGAIPVFLYLPDGTDNVDPATGLNYPEKRLFSFCSTAKIVCFSARPYLEQSLKHVTYNPSGHYDADTNRIIARGLAKDLMAVFSGFFSTASGSLR